MMDENQCNSHALTLDVSAVDRMARSGHLKAGGINPVGLEIGANSLFLTLGGKPWCPVMGEFHYSRYPESEWRDELLKMKAGGIDIVSTYVFWIHHEEVEGEWDWSGRRNLRAFVQVAQEAGLKVAVRLGPWCHGEVRNGGHPDWLLQKGWIVRSDDPRYLDKVRLLYGQIAAQLKGLLWKDGGPVAAVQIENEYDGLAQHLLTLKAMACDAGLDVPLYTRTGWPALKDAMPMGELLPLYGSYAEGFWDRELTSMPGNYWAGFHFSLLRTDTAIATDVFGGRKAQDEPGTEMYPFLTCEIGGGMAVCYHRRILIQPRDVESTTLVKLGSGGNLPGYYMYHGGTNPEGQKTTLQETQASGMWNDLPDNGYDFQAPLGEFGQVRPHFHCQRLLHLFLRDFGSKIAGLVPQLPDQRPGGQDDRQTLRWAVRSDGGSGILFVNNYERAREMPAHAAVRFRIKFASEELSIPHQPVTIPANSVFFWPLNLDLGGVTLKYATAQPICQIESDGKTFSFFAVTRGVPAEFAFDSDVTTSGTKTRHGGLTIVQAKPGTGAAIELRNHVIVLLDSDVALDCYKAVWRGKERVFLGKAVVVPDGDALRLLANDGQPQDVRVFPAPEDLVVDKQEIRGQQDGVFTCYAVPASPRKPVTVTVEQLQVAGPLRDITMGSHHVASGPVAANFAQAAVWRVKLPGGLDRKGDYLLRVHYTGDVIRAYLGDQFLTDDFYNGNAFELGLKRFAPEVFNKDLLLKILPLGKDAPIFMAESAKPAFGVEKARVSIDSIELIERREVRLVPNNR